MAGFSGKSYRTKNVCSDFLYNFLPETFLVLRSERDIVINVHRSSCQIVTKLEFSRQIFATSPNIKFHGNPSSGSRVVLCLLTGRRTDITQLIVALCSFASRVRPPQADTKWKKTCQKMKTGRSDRFRKTLRQGGEMNSFENDRGECLAGEIIYPSTLKTVVGEEKYAYLSADNVYYELKSCSLWLGSVLRTARTVVYV
jgi:hypothetical protein